jgi:mutator protein MutT
MERQTFPIVIALVRDEQGRLLIARRYDEELPDGNGKWELVGGKIEWNETPEQAIIREVKEETGLDVEIVRLLPKLFNSYWKKKDGTEFKVILLPYECKIVGGQLHNTGYDHKIAELKFIDYSELRNYQWVGPVIDMVLLPYG